MNEYILYYVFQKFLTYFINEIHIINCIKLRGRISTYIHENIITLEMESQLLDLLHWIKLQVTTVEHCTVTQALE